MNEDLNLMTTAELSKVYLGTIRQEGYFKNESLQQLSDELKDILTTFFLRPIKPGVAYTFSHEISLEYNAAFQACHSIFEDPAKFLEQSQQLLKLLYSVSENQNIIEGEFYTAYFDKIYLEGRYMPAVGIFKSESKDPFLTIGQADNDLKMESQQGISIHNIHKGALIYHDQEHPGFQLSIFDKNSIKQPARFWIDDFLNVNLLEDDFYKTKQVIDLCRDFAKKGQNDLNGADRADLLNRTLDYFNTNDSFNLPEFEASVLQDESTMQSFYEHREKVQDHVTESSLEDAFEISAPAIQKAKKYVRSVIKLDKNFHLYVHGGRDMIERGYDDGKNKNYYKIYFDNEH